MNGYFVIVSVNDTPVYTADFFKPEIAMKVSDRKGERKLLIFFLFLLGRPTIKFPSIHAAQCTGPGSTPATNSTDLVAQLLY